LSESYLDAMSVAGSGSEAAEVLRSMIKGV